MTEYTVVFKSRNGGSRSSWNVFAKSKLDAQRLWEESYSSLWYDILWIA